MHVSLHFMLGIAKAKYILVMSVVSVCMCVGLSVPHHVLTQLHGPGCNLRNSRECPLVVHFWVYFTGARVSLLWQQSAEREMSASACTHSMPG